MEVQWNMLNLERPPNVTWRTDSKIFDAQAFLNTLNAIVKDIVAQETLNQEAAILSRLIYRMKTKFRNDKGLKNMEKVNKALLRHLTVALDKEYLSLKTYVDVDGRSITLPSKQMLECVLIRTLGYGKLMSRVEQVSSLAAKYFKARINAGQAWTISLVAYAILCRIWILSRHIITKCCIWYDSLYQHLKNFNMVGVPWLLPNFELPTNMKAWIQLSWMDEDTTSESLENSWKDPMFKLLTVQKGNNENEDIPMVGEEKAHVPEITDNPSGDAMHNAANNMQNDDELEDLGEVVDRDAFMLSQMNQTNQTTQMESALQKLDLSKDEGNTLNNSESSENSETSNSFPRDQQTNEMENLRRNTEYENLHLKMKRLAKRISPNKESKRDDISVKLELIDILNKDSCPGLDKLQWNIIKNKSKHYLKKFDKTPENKKKMALLKKLICTIESSVK